MSKYTLKIAALLAKAESSNHEAEAKTYRDKAQELMLREGIDQAMIDDVATDRPESIIRETVDMLGQWHGGLFEMGRSVGTALRLKIFIIRIDSNKHTRLVVVGHESDVARFITLVESLKVQAEFAMKEWWKTERKVNGWMYDANTGWTAKRQFIMSFGTGVASVLRSQQRELAAPGTSTDLVLVSREAKIDGWVDANMKVGKASGRGMLSGSSNAASSGFQAGRNANTRGTRGQLS